MKKVIIVLFLFTLIISLKNNQEEYIIPEKALRLRVIANSNTIEDQNTKILIKNDIEDVLKTDLLQSSSLENAKKTVSNKIPEIKQILNKYQISYNLNLGQNYFPEKKYKGVTYPSGQYESLVVTLGKGEGENWWCVLYPPLCYMDLSNIEKDEVTYKSFVKEVFDKYL